MSDALAKLWEKSKQLIAEKKWDEAIAVLSKIIEANPNDAKAFNNRGFVYNEKGEYDLAIADCDKAIELNPKYSKAYNNRGIAYSKKNEYDLAIADFDKAIELNPNNAKAYNNRGIVYNKKGEYDLAIADFNKAIELNPKFAEAYNNRGIAYSKKNEYDLAIADCDKAIKLEPKGAEAYNNRGLAYQNKGEYEKALADFNKAIELKPNFEEAIHNRAVTLALRISKKEQGKITEQYQEQLKKQGQDFEQNQEKREKQHQEQLEKQQQDFDKEFEDIVGTLDYEKIVKEYDDELKYKNIYLRNLFVSLWAIAIVAYGGVFYIVYPIKAGVSSFIVFPYVILATLVLSPLVWWIRIVVRDKYKIWALREDARSKRVLTTITRFAKGDYKEVILKLLEYHGTNSSANLILDRQREAKGGSENVVNIVKETVNKKDDS